MQSNQVRKYQNSNSIHKIKKSGKKLVPLCDNIDIIKLYKIKLEYTITKLKQMIDQKQSILQLTIRFLDSQLSRISKNEYYYNQKKNLIDNFHNQIMHFQRHIQQIDNILSRLRDNIDIQNQKMIIEANQHQFKQSTFVLEEGQIIGEDEESLNGEFFQRKQYNLLLQGVQNLDSTQSDLKSQVIAKIYHNNKKWHDSINKLNQIKQPKEFTILRLYGLNYMEIIKENGQNAQFYTSEAIKYLSKCVQKPWKEIDSCFSLLGEAYYLKNDINNMEYCFLKELEFGDNLNRHKNKLILQAQIFQKIAKKAIILGNLEMGFKYYNKAIESSSLLNQQKRISFLLQRIKYIGSDTQSNTGQQIQYYKEVISFIEKRNQISNNNKIKLCMLYHKLASLYAKIQKYNQSIDCVNYAFKYTNNLNQEYVNYAFYHYQLKMYNQAKNILQNGLKMDKYNKLAYELLAKIKYDTLGQLDCVIYLKKLDKILYTQWDLDILINFHENEGDRQEVSQLRKHKKSIIF